MAGPPDPASRFKLTPNTNAWAKKRAEQAAPNDDRSKSTLKRKATSAAAIDDDIPGKKQASSSAGKKSARPVSSRVTTTKLNSEHFSPIPNAAEKAAVKRKTSTFVITDEEVPAKKQAKKQSKNQANGPGNSTTSDTVAKSGSPHVAKIESASRPDNEMPATKRSTKMSQSTITEKKKGIPPRKDSTDAASVEATLIKYNDASQSTLKKETVEPDVQSAAKTEGATKAAKLNAEEAPVEESGARLTRSRAQKAVEDGDKSARKKQKKHGSSEEEVKKEGQDHGVGENGKACEEQGDAHDKSAVKKKAVDEERDVSKDKSVGNKKDMSEALPMDKEQDAQKSASKDGDVAEKSAGKEENVAEKKCVDPKVHTKPAAERAGNKKGTAKRIIKNKR